jgi:amino acid transporter
MAKSYDDDEATLQAMGYRQELLRRMSAFSNYAISLSIICILAGGITSFHLAFCATGGAGVVLGWPLMSLMALAFAATMGQLASAFPTAGGLYHWASTLGGRGWGWVTALFNLAGLITVLAAINVGTFRFCWGALGALTDIQLSAQTEMAWQTGIVFAISVTQAMLNHQGIRATTWLTDFCGYLILILALMLTVSLIVYAPSIDLSRLIIFNNYSGLPVGKDQVWPRSESMLKLFALGLMLPAYTITGFDASAHISEETIGATRAVPRSIVRAVWVSGLFGWIMLIAIVLAIPSFDEAASQGGNVFFWTIAKVLPNKLAIGLCAGIAIVQYICGLATVTSASRMTFAFARDEGLPFSNRLKQVSPAHRTPVAAIWTVALFSFAFTIFTPVYSTITTVCVIFLYISYMLPTYLGLRAFGKTWNIMGPWTLGKWYRPLAAICLLGGISVFVIGVQPPNEMALQITLGVIGFMAVFWFGHCRTTFEGPPHLKQG